MSNNAWLAAYEAQKAALAHKKSGAASASSNVASNVDLSKVVKSTQVTKILDKLKTESKKEVSASGNAGKLNLNPSLLK
jgi:hypothetical protein